jgi:hypothetical protein
VARGSGFDGQGRPLSGRDTKEIADQAAGDGGRPLVTLRASRPSLEHEIDGGDPKPLPGAKRGGTPGREARAIQPGSVPAAEIFYPPIGRDIADPINTNQPGVERRDDGERQLDLHVAPPPDAHLGLVGADFEGALCGRSLGQYGRLSRDGLRRGQDPKAQGHDRKI